MTGWSASRSVWRRRRASLQLSSGSFLAGNKCACVRACLCVCEGFNLICRARSFMYQGLAAAAIHKGIMFTPVVIQNPINVTNDALQVGLV